MMNKTLSRKENETLLRKNFILEAAAELFANKGYENTTMEEIAKHAEFSKGSLYQYFASKEDIYLTIYFNMVEELTVVLDKVISKTDAPIEKLGKLLKAIFEYAYKNKKITKILLQQEKSFFYQPLKIRENFQKKVGNKFFENITDILDLQETTIKEDPEVLNVIFSGMFLGSLEYLLNNDCKKELFEKLSQSIVSVFFFGCIKNKKL